MFTKKAMLASTIHALCLGIGVGSLPSQALGQDSNEGVEDGGKVEEIVVTGSRIKRDSFSYSAPVAIIDSVDMDAVGTTNVGDVLQTLPQAIATNNNANSAFFTTSAGVNLTDLRFLGTDRTLVLVNGRRFVSGVNPGVGYGVDLNAIPTAVIDRIEVLTGGASAVYGSDAVAGVVNVVTKTDFEGVDVTAQVGASGEGDKNREDITLTVGGEFAKGGNGWLSFGWSNDDALFAKDRDFSNTDLAVYDLDGDGFGETDDWLGSSFPPIGRFGGFLGDGSPFRSGLADRENSDRFNRAEFRTIFVPVERRFGAGQANYQLTDNFNVFAEMNFSLVEAKSQLEPFALDINDDIFIQSRGGTGGIDVASSLLINEPLRAALLGAGINNINELGLTNAVRRLVEFGPRSTDIDRTTIRGVAGFDYVLPNGWDVNGYYTYGKTDHDQTSLGQINTERAAFALDVETAPDGMTIQCVDATARLQGCVPFNPFGEGTITPEAVSYLQAPANFQAIVEQRVAGLGLSGETGWTLPGGAFAFALGAEYREERGRTIPGGFLQQGVSGGNASLPTNGKFDVTEIYGEISAPVHDRLTLDAAIRAGDYSSVGSTTTWKLGADAVLHDTLRLRATVAESVRAPNIADLFRGPGETFRNVQDPCDGITNASTGVVADNCRSVPVIQDRINDQGIFELTQVERQSAGGFLLGNPEVEEETADSITLGFVWQPEFANFSASFDYYDIELRDAIAITSRTTVTERCYNVEQSMFDPTCNGAVLRDLQAGRGALVSVDSASSNENDFNTSGVDLEFAYGRNLGPGDIRFGMLWNYLIEWDEIGIVDGDLDANAGEIVTPRNRGTGHVAYNWGSWQAFWRFRYWHRSTDSNTPNLTNENSDVFGNPLHPSKNEIASITYNDVSVAYAQDRYAVTVGVNNVFDKQPPLLTQISQWGNTGTNTATEAYDTVGRAWFLQFNYAY